MIAPIFGREKISPVLELAMGRAWRKLALREGNHPSHRNTKMGVSANVQSKIVRALEKRGKAWAAQIASDIGETPSKCTAYLLRMCELGVITRRTPASGEVPKWTQWIYEPRKSK